MPFWQDVVDEPAAHPGDPYAPRDLCGVGASGRNDLATNRDHLQGFGE